ncbi:unnamed protein product [Rhizophagus irregularis]|nr:unnamed protein product [Rhizophagus irregularis]CAB4380032.1 unnamed protein product [Rhizophagus irregularis]CAB4383555.1 unnamed protein product [Rhizophagus irregularis]CAB4399472.1 unnamed protein product [Rhizophagus irregularis]
MFLNYNYQRSINDWILTETSGNTFLELDFGLKTSASWIIWNIGFCLPGFFISAFWIIWDIGFCLPRFCLPGFFISDSWIIWDIGFRLPGLFGILVCGVGLL